MRLRSLLLVLLLPCAAALAQKEPATASTPARAVEFAGLFEHPATFDQTQLAALPRNHIEADDHGTKGAWDGVAMLDLLRKTGAPMDDALRGKQLTKIVLFTAADGYRVAIALADFDPAFGNAQAILADTRDGKPLDAKEGPFRLIIEGEQRPGRWIRQVMKIELIDAAPANK